jgi:ATP-dependent protease ClpP protease subunit
MHRKSQKTVYLNTSNRNRVLNTKYRKKIENELKKSASNGRPEITFEITCDGGDYEEGMRIYEAIRRYPGKTIGHVHQACSMGLVIVQACTVRKAYEDAELMFHELSVTLGRSIDERKLTLTELVRLANESKKDQHRLNEAMASRTPGYNASYWARCKKDRYFTPQRALRMGLIDEIIYQ